MFWWLAPNAEEHVARLKAEADAENAARRLAVAQEQIAEYAQVRSPLAYLWLACQQRSSWPHVKPISIRCPHLDGHGYEGPLRVSGRLIPPACW